MERDKPLKSGGGNEIAKFGRATGLGFTGRQHGLCGGGSRCFRGNRRRIHGDRARAVCVRCGDTLGDNEKRQGHHSGGAEF